MFVMDSTAQLKVDIISKVSEGKISITNATQLLNKSRRTIERYLSEYNKVGIQFVIHKNCGKQPANKSSDALKIKVQTLIKNKYFDVNLVHLAELLESHEHITVKRETLRTWAHEIHHVKRAKKRWPKARKQRCRMESPGLMLQMDGSTHQWFGDKKSCLIAVIDDATSELYAEFFDAETTLGCLQVLNNIIARKGVFKILYVDRAGIFGGPKRCNFSQVQRACNELGIEIIFANSPQGKGRIERSFNTLQDRLIPELRLNAIHNMKEANDYLQNIFIPNYWNKKMIVEPSNDSSGFEPIKKHTNLSTTFVIKEYRKIRNDHTFSYGNKLYLIKSSLKKSIAKQEIEIRVSSKNKFTAYFANQLLEIAEVVQPSKPARFEPEIQMKIDAIELADKLQNVAEAARRMGVSRETIYKNKRLLAEKGPHALKRTFNKKHHHKNRTSETTENKVIQFSLENPHLGQAQVALHINKLYHTTISAGGVRNIWLRKNMQTVAMRIKMAHNHQADMTSIPN